MRLSISVSCWVTCWLASTAVAIPPREPVKSYKSYGANRSGVSDATPSFSPVASSKMSKNPAMPMGASGNSVTRWPIPGGVPSGSMLPGPADYYRPNPNNQNTQATWGQAKRPSNRPDYRPDYRPGGSRPNVVINRPQTNINNTTINNTTIINQNIVNQNIINRPGYGYPYGNLPASYYSQLHYHWQPSVWSQPYRPAYYNYGYSSVGGSWLSVGGTTISYVNPFYVRSSTSLPIRFDYSQPIRVPDSTYRETRDDLVRSELAIRRFDDAREIFRRGEYGRASELIDEAIELLPNDPTLHQFRALVLFARERYQESAAVLYSVLAVSPGWDASTISKLYESPSRYLMQVNVLAQYAASHPEAIDSQFLLAYHYALKGDLVGAERQLLRVDSARPGDRVVESLLAALRR